MTATSPIPSRETPRYLRVLMKNHPHPSHHLNCRPTQLHVLTVPYGRPNGTNPKQGDGLFESSNLRLTLCRSQLSDWGG